MDSVMRHVERSGQVQRMVQFRGLQLRIAMLNDDLASAEMIIKDANQIIKGIGRLFIVQFFYADYGIGLCLQTLALLERSSPGNGTRSRNTIKRNALKAVRDAVRANRSYALDRTESLRLAGIYCWLCGKHKNALRWWNKSIDEGERIGARLELSRTYFEVGKRIFASVRPPSPGGGVKKNTSTQIPPSGDRGASVDMDRMIKKIIGLTPEECLAKAETMFREMDLQWDLAELEKVRTQLR